MPYIIISVVQAKLFSNLYLIKFLNASTILPVHILSILIFHTHYCRCCCCCCCYYCCCDIVVVVVSIIIKHINIYNAILIDIMKILHNNSIVNRKFRNNYAKIICRSSFLKISKWIYFWENF